MTMIDKLVEVLRKAENNIEPWPTSKEHYFKILAKAMLFAMLEPTNEMISAAKWFNEQAGFNHIDVAGAAYKNMINVALKEIE